MATGKAAAKDTPAADGRPVPGSGAGKGAETANPLEHLGVATAGEAQAAPDPEAVSGDPHVHNSLPGAKVPGASGTPLPKDAAEAADRRREAGIPEPPKVGPNKGTALFDTPGGYQAVPEGFTPESLEEAHNEARRR